MDEKSQRLRATISELERELRGGEPIDNESRAMLSEAVEEIQAALHSKTPGGESEPHTLNERLTDAAASFDASHPTLAGLLRRVVDALSQLGI